MEKVKQERRPISRRGFLKLGLGLVGAAVISTTIVEPKVAMAQKQSREAVPVEQAKPKSDWEMMQEAKQARIKKFITEADALVARYGHANY